MFTIHVYWNATKFTRYEGVGEEKYFARPFGLEIILSDEREIIIPWTSINRIEVIKDDS